MSNEVQALDEFHAHEAMHVAHVLQNMVAHELEGHPAVAAYPEVSRLVGEVQDRLGELYQAIGRIRFGEEK